MALVALAPSSESRRSFGGRALAIAPGEMLPTSREPGRVACIGLVRVDCVCAGPRVRRRESPVRRRLGTGAQDILPEPSSDRFLCRPVPAFGSASACVSSSQSLGLPCRAEARCSSSPISSSGSSCAHAMAGALAARSRCRLRIYVRHVSGGLDRKRRTGVFAVGVGYSFLASLLGQPLRYRNLGVARKSVSCRRTEQVHAMGRPTPDFSRCRYRLPCCYCGMHGACSCRIFGSGLLQRHCSGCSGRQPVSPIHGRLAGGG